MNERDGVLDVVWKISFGIGRLTFLSFRQTFNVRRISYLFCWGIVGFAWAVQDPTHVKNGAGRRGTLDHNYLNQLVEQHYRGTDLSCSQYQRGSRTSKYSIDYLKLFAQNAAERLCQGSFAEGGALELYVKKVTSYKSVFTDVLKRVPEKPASHFTRGGSTNVAMLYSMNLALSMDETDGNPLAPKHTGSSLPQEWEAGLGHLSTNSLYSEVLAPIGGVPKGGEQKPMRSLLLDYVEKIQSSMQKTESTDSSEGSDEFSKLCGYSHFTPDYWDAVVKLSSSPEFPDGTSVLSKDKAGKITQYNYTAERGLRELRNVNLKGFQAKLKEAIEHETTLEGSGVKLMISEKFFTTSEGRRFVSQFRNLMWYCPKLAIELQGLSLRLNSTHQGSISRNELKPHCPNLFEELFKNEAKVCGYVQ